MIAIQSAIVDNLQVTVIRVIKLLYFSSYIREAPVLRHSLIYREQLGLGGPAAVLEDLVELSVVDENQDLHVAHLRQLYGFLEQVAPSFALEVGPPISVLDQLFRLLSAIHILFHVQSISISNYIFINIQFGLSIM